MRDVASMINVEWKRNNAYDEITSFFFLLKVLKGKDPSEFLAMMEKAGRYKKYLEEYADFRNENVEDLEWIWDKYKKDAADHNDWSDWRRYIIGYNLKLEEAQNEKNGVMLYYALLQRPGVEICIHHRLCKRRMPAQERRNGRRYRRGAPASFMWNDPS